MLQHYSPYKIAENFNLLASLAPGRVDLGIGKAPGGLPLSTRALQAGYDPARRASFADLAEELNRHLEGDDATADATDQDGATLHATPRPPGPRNRSCSAPARKAPRSPRGSAGRSSTRRI